MDSLKKHKEMRQLISVIILFLFFSQSAFAQVGIGTANPDSSAVLELSSNSKGFLPPRMTSINRMGIISPALGLIVYQTDGVRGLYHYNGVNWSRLLDEDLILVGDGSVQQPSLSFKNRPDVGFFRSGNSMLYATAGDTVFQLEARNALSEVTLTSYAKNRLSFTSYAAYVQIARGNLFEFRGGANSDINFIGYRHSSADGKTIVVKSGIVNPRLPFAVQGGGGTNIQEWRGPGKVKKAYIDSTGNMVLTTGGIVINEAVPSPKSGMVRLSSGVAFVSNTAISNKSRIFISNNGASGTVGLSSAAKTNGFGFWIVSSSPNDNSLMSWFIIDAE